MRIFLFGANRNSRFYINYLEENGLADSVYGFIDNGIRWRDEAEFCGKPVFSPYEKAVPHFTADSVIIIMTATDSAVQIAKQLKENSYIRYLFLKDIENVSLEELKALLTEENDYVLFARSLAFETDVRISQIGFLINHIDSGSLLPDTGYIREYQMKLLDLGKRLTDYAARTDAKPFIICGNLLGYTRHNGFIPWDDDLDFGMIRNEYDDLIRMAREDGILFEYDGRYDIRDVDKWADSIVQEHKGELLILKSPFRLRAIVCTENHWPLCPCADIDPFDVYSGEVSFADHNRFLDSVVRKGVGCTTCEEQRTILEKAFADDAQYKEADGEYLYTGVDCWDTYFNGTNKNWYYRKDVFPLQKADYEGESFYIPANPIGCQISRYGENYMKLPMNAALHLHNKTTTDS